MVEEVTLAAFDLAACSQVFICIAAELRSSEAIRGSSLVCDRGADGLERAGTYLRSASGERLLAEAASLSNEHKWVVTAAAATGFATSRWLKAATVGRDRAKPGPESKKRAIFLLDSATSTIEVLRVDDCRDAYYAAAHQLRRNAPLVAAATAL